jgi:hypothetical protein
MDRADFNRIIGYAFKKTPPALRPDLGLSSAWWLKVADLDAETFFAALDAETNGKEGFWPPIGRVLDAYHDPELPQATDELCRAVLGRSRQTRIQEVASSDNVPHGTIEPPLAWFGTLHRSDVGVEVAGSPPKITLSAKSPTREVAWEIEPGQGHLCRRLPIPAPGEKREGYGYEPTIDVLLWVAGRHAVYLEQSPVERGRKADDTTPDKSPRTLWLNKERKDNSELYSVLMALERAQRDARERAKVEPKMGFDEYIAKHPEARTAWGKVGLATGPVRAEDVIEGSGAGK